MMLKLSFLFTLMLIEAAAAGPWPRQKGQGFAMSSLQVTAASLSGPENYYFSTYLEYGLTNQLTLGADIGHSVSGETKGIMFLRHPIWLRSQTHHFAAELGLGTIAGNSVIRPGMSYGRSFEYKESSGWLTVDGLLEHHLGQQISDFKFDITYGRTYSNDFKAMVQIQAGKQQGDSSFLRLAPSFALPAGKSTHVEIGGSVGLRGASEYGLKVGFWRAF